MTVTTIRKDFDMRSYWVATFTILGVLLLLHSTSAQRNTSPLEALVASVDGEVEGKLFRNSIAAVEITDVRSGKTLYSRNANLLLRPASNTKLFTSAAVLLGIDDSGTFSTDLALTGSATLVCAAGGDPLFRLKDIQKLTEIALGAGISHIDTLLLDAAEFDTTVFGEGWMWDDESDPFLPALSPFCLERNIFTLNIKQDTQVHTELDVSSIPLIPNLEWSWSRSPKPLTVIKEPRSNRFQLHGTLGRGERFSKSYPVWQPQSLFADAFARSLREAGLADSTLSIMYGSAPDERVELGTVVRPLDEVLAAMNKESNNLCAEMALRLLGLRSAVGTASARAGIAAMEKLFTDRGLVPGGLSLVDGSGISFYNLATATSITRVLRMMAAHPLFERYRASLSVASVDGTLRNRLKDDKMGKFFQGKTGTLRGVSALSGYVQAPGGRLLTVVLLMQNFSGDGALYRRAQDRIVRHCIEYSASPAASTQPR
ncbi:MAG: D-alanyl-D-alanine carboxypeptidase/D-alanyl-D-alanine-endopeptidase [Bacteroidia bacterium]|nr:D-alanyl-D-alanine carboxypeptidase/D-alanyl-D-alanine-endopeptidase [Bacteroidia bacterium]